MGKPTFWDNVKDWFHHIIWRMYCGVILNMTDKEYNELDYCPFCNQDRENWEESEE